MQDRLVANATLEFSSCRSSDSSLPASIR